MKNTSAFTFIEILISIAIIGILATMAGLAMVPIRHKAKDTKRKSEISQIGRFLSINCYLPNAGNGEYDLRDLINEFKMRYPQYANSVPSDVKDPKSGTKEKSFYKYIVKDDGDGCVLYANLESESEQVTLPDISVPTTKKGLGVFQASSPGWNGSTKYFQVSN